MLLPIADGKTVGRVALGLARRHRGRLTGVLALHTLAAAAALVPPIVIGRLVQDVSTDAVASDTLPASAAALLTAVTIQALMLRFAQRSSIVLGEEVVATLREDLVRDLVRLPLTTVEQASSGDLLSRTTNDIDSLALTVRFAVPRILIVTVTVIVTTFAALLLNPLVALSLFLGGPVLAVTTRRYLRRSSKGYARQLASFATLSGTVSETVEGAETVEALSLRETRNRDLDAALRERYESDRYTLHLRTFFFPIAGLALTLPIVVVLGWGAALVAGGLATVGAVTTIALLTAQLAGPIGELVAWANQVQVSAAALARMVGVSQVTPAISVSAATPASEELTAEGVRYFYEEGVDVLHGIDLTLVPGERLAIVGATGSGKSTLARLLSGIDTPTSGQVEIGGVALGDLSVRDLRTHVALATQEHHIFVGTVADNLRLARPGATEGEILEVLSVVGAADWLGSLPDGLTTRVGSGGFPLTPAQSQQLALGRLLLLDPANLVLDEATSLLDPSAARTMERTLSGLLAGRTVLAIAHRLHTAHDADRIAVMRDGLLAEVGTHAALLEHGGEYAELWRAWNSRDAEPPLLREGSPG
jgi:ABC-type multidrug transport system fused ATPase/permease subunit